MNKKYVLIGILIFFILAFIALNLGITFNFMTKDEIHIELNPLQVQYQTTNDQPVEVEIEIETNNFWFCKAVCDFTLTDGYSQKILFQNRENVTETVTKKFNIDLNTIGTGQRHYYFEASCKNTKSYLCRTPETEYFRSSLITINHELNQYDKELKLQNEKEIENLLISLNNIERLENELSEYIKPDNKIKNKIIEAKELWENEKYSQIETTKEAYDYEDELLKLKASKNLQISNYNQVANKINKLNSTYINEANKLFSKLNRTDIINKWANVTYIYNNLDLQNAEELNKIDISFNYNLNRIKTLFETSIDLASTKAELKQNNISYQTNATNFCDEYGNLIKIVNQTNSIRDNLSSTNTTFNITINSQYYEDYCLKQIPNLVDELSPLKINLKKQIETKNQTNPLILKEPKSKCCIFNSCHSCGEKNPTPIIFLHGHSFNLDNPVESSLLAFNKIQKKLNNEGIIINAGDIDTETNIDGAKWSEMNIPIGIRASYYFLLYYDIEIYSANIKKTENIETYSIRLREIIDIVKKKTGSEKVVIVAHSMGGLVTRNYMKLFGDSDLEKVILLTVPNQGIDDTISKYCSTLGSSRECEDMDKESLFIKKLGQSKPAVEIHNIYATGCTMGNKTGDGVVTTDSAMLDGAKNYKILGNCPDSFGISLHNDVLDPLKYPRVYETIRDILTE